MRLRTYIHLLHWNFLTLMGLLYISIGIGWLLLGIPFEGGNWILRFALVGIGFVLIALSTIGKVQQ